MFCVGTGKNQCIYDCDKADLDDKNSYTFNIYFVIFKIEPEDGMNKDAYGIVESEADEEAGKSHDQGDGIRTSRKQNDNKKEFYLEQSHGILLATICMHDDFDDRLNCCC